MADNQKILSLMFVSFLLIFSYNFMVDEVQDASDADPTHSGKAFLADVFPYFWLVLILASLAATAYVIFQELD